MKYMKTAFILILALILIISFVSCTNKPTAENQTSEITTAQQTTENTTQPEKELWQWKKDTPENQNIDSDDLVAVHSIPFIIHFLYCLL